LQLRPQRPDDWDALSAVASDPLIWEQHPERDRYRPEVFRRYFDSGIASAGAFAVVDTASGRIIGSSRYHGYDEAKREVEIGWTFLTRAYWGRGYNREMKTLMLDHAFKFVDRVCFNVGRTNYRSQAAMRKIGGVEAGTCVNSLGAESIVFVIRAPRPSPNGHSPESGEARDLPCGPRA
jgi:RimJ/RimL family protein N-acetyltransferase